MICQLWHTTEFVGYYSCSTLIVSVNSLLGDAVQYGGSGVIYALSQYSPFISIPRYPPNTQIQSTPFIEDENSNLGIEDAELKSSTASSARVSPSTQEQPLCNEPGKHILVSSLSSLSW